MTITACTTIFDTLSVPPSVQVRNGRSPFTQYKENSSREQFVIPVHPLTSNTVKLRQSFNRLSIAVKTAKERRFVHEIENQVPWNESVTKDS